MSNRRTSNSDRHRPRVAIVGGGVFGLAHAWSAARRGWRVFLFERDKVARGASVRNFGMVWPIGQPNGPAHRRALHSRRLWSEVLAETGLWSQACGSLHLAHREDELAVLEEFAHLAPELGYDCELLSPAAAAARCSAIRGDGLCGALWSASELAVDPREVVARLPALLCERYGVELFYGVAIDRVAGPWVAATSGDQWSVDQVVVATGADVRLLYPEAYAAAGFRRCKLQMLRTVPQPAGWRMGPHLASGLTLRHYENFAVCRSLAALKKRIAQETPELDQYGIHVMAAQNGAGEVVLGDSHEYGDDVGPFDKSVVEELILRELRRIIDLPDWTVAERWHGEYIKAPNLVQYADEPEPNVRLAISSGGAGMTMSFGLADEFWSQRADDAAQAQGAAANQTVDVG